MTRFYLRFMIYPLIVAGVVILLVCAQPHNDHDLRWLPVNNCLSACFLGIHPGKTTIEEAVKLLKAHPWISQVMPMNTRGSYRIGWFWSDDVPDFLKHTTTNPDFPADGGITFDNGVVRNIGFNTHLTFGDIALAWTYPNESQLVLPGLMIGEDSSVLAVVNIKYDDYQISGTLNCPYTTHIWQTPIHINVTRAPNPLFLGFMPADGRSFLGSIRHTSQLMCSRQF